MGGGGYTASGEGKSRVARVQRGRARFMACFQGWVVTAALVLDDRKCHESRGAEGRNDAV